MGIAALLLAIVFSGSGRTTAQTAPTGTNLLANPSLEKPYNGNGVSSTQTAPVSWILFASGTDVVSFPHIDPAQIHSGASAWNFHSSNIYNAGGYQQVTGIAVGSTLHATFYAQGYTCTDTVHSCIGSDGLHHSNPGSGMYFKVGVDPTGGTNPASGQIVWSPNVTAFDSWGQPVTDAINCNTTVTFFMYVGETGNMFINSAYFDDASLVITATGTNTTVTPCGVTTGVTPGAIVPTSGPVYAAFVTKQAAGQQPDGSILHTVQAGDTLAAIAVAYGITLDQIRKLNNILPGDNILRIGQKILVKAPDSGILPTATLPPAPPNGQSPTQKPNDPFATPPPTSASAAIPPTSNAIPATAVPPTAIVPAVSPTSAINSLIPGTGAGNVNGTIGSAPTIVPLPPTDIEFF